MNSQSSLFQINSFNFKLNHLIIIGVLILAFSTSFLIRSQPAQYGNELNEFDPFFNFRATEYIVENGLSEYFQWHDTKSWYYPPDSNGNGVVDELDVVSGRNVSATSQSMLHITAAITYEIFGGNSSLYDFTVYFPALIGSLTAIVIFGFYRLSQRKIEDNPESTFTPLPTSLTPLGIELVPDTREDLSNNENKNN